MNDEVFKGRISPKQNISFFLRIPSKLKCSLNIHLALKSANQELNMVLIYALVLMLLPRFVPNSTH